MTLPKGYKQPSKPGNELAKFNQNMFSRPITAVNLLETYNYEIDILRGNDGEPKLNVVGVRPLELDASLVFYNKKSGEGVFCPIYKITDMKITNRIVGTIRKKDDLLVEMEVELPHGYDNIMIFDMDDKLINQFMEQVNYIRNKLFDENLWTSVILNFKSSTGLITPIQIYPSIPFLSSGEQIVWNNIKTKGIVNKKIQWLDLVTDYRVYQYDYINKLANFVLICAIDDVVVNNQRRTSDSNRYGTYTHSRYVTGVLSNTTTTSTAIGDVVIMANGKPYVTFTGVSDPNGLARVIKSMRKQCNFTISNNEIFEIVEPMPENIIQENENPIVSNPAIEEMMLCSNCGKQNLPNSIFCNQCGSKLEIIPTCKQCGHVNLADAMFCNQCGNKL